MHPTWWRWAVGLLTVVALMGSAVSPVAGSAKGGSIERLHPYLARLADASPQTWVDVIISKASNANEKDIEKASGGNRLRSWSFVNAMHLHVPASALRGLARHPGVMFVAPDSPMQGTDLYDQTKTDANVQAALNIQQFWHSLYLGNGVGVAVLDSGVAAHPDLQGHTVNVVLPSIGDWQDSYGHGTHVAGIIAGAGADMTHLGVAPKATIYNIRVTDNAGNGTESNLISGLEWVFNNHAQYNIRVVNISMQSTIASSYLNSPLAGAVEKLWFDGVVVVVSAGNRGTVADAAYYPPANDPYVLTIGAMDDYGTKGGSDDTVVAWSSQGVTQNGFKKPDILAPGRRILSTLAPGSQLALQYPNRIFGQYLSISGSSMAAPAISGAVATMLQFQPTLTPDQVKYILVSKHRPPLQGQIKTSNAGATAMDQVFSAIKTPGSVPFANQGLTPSNYANPNTSFSALNIYYDNIYYMNVEPMNLYYGD